MVDIGNPADRNKPGKVILSGYITNIDTREAVAGATVYIPKLSMGTVSNEYGFYALTAPRGNHSARVSFIGMKERQIDVNLYGPGEVNIEMKSTLVPLKETIVSADKNVTLQRFEVGVEKINITSFRLMPTSMGESDIIKSILLIPGVQSVGEGSAGFKDEDRTTLSKRFYGQPEMELIMDDYIKLPVMQEIFFELTPGIRLNSRKAGYEMIVRNPVDNIVYEKPSLVMIDGVIIYDYEIIANLDPETVERIDATRTPYLTGDIIHYGIINIITRTGNLRNITLPDYAARLQYRVADPIPLFSAPDYSDPGSKKSRIPDFRNTLFWNPSMKPDNDGKVIIEFWTSDRVLDYVVNIQGISDNGELISVKERIKVN